MVVRRRKKYHKYKGERHARRGYNDRNRNAGIRGGRGKAGYGKMKDHKKSIYIPAKGFNNPTTKEIKAINIRTIVENLDNLYKKGLVTKEGDKYIIDLEKLGYNKLIGRLTKPYPIVVKAKYIAETTKENLQSLGIEIE
ncbi:NEQ317 [Nanoarchaeum equitans Kin4-M]|uniref:Large ribosomal subunit protein uL15 n=1 Tax=Nanoarchaeum equitans (strain Kin4-M) TaxID=228908 RepID=Q74MA5_NANEQ|nr:NEQ317 [Nanoarchaeum equitans Kin4-M]